ncbi:hypothetical protein [Aestuariimicrobium sp. Y1814]|uniref:hypothetical protein n=1 Tax=Aestuariimicrobium sp. Y1814 TaxID=3418742 RepID=UPI003DA7830E
MTSPVGRTLAALAVAGALALAGCSSSPTGGETTSQPAITVDQSSAPATQTTGETQTTSQSPAPTDIETTTSASQSPTGPGDYQVGHGLVLTLPQGWELTLNDTDDDEVRHLFTHLATGTQLAVLTDDDDDDSAAEICEDVQDDIEDGFEGNGPVTRTQGTTHADNAVTCGLTATDNDGVEIEVTIFAAVGANTSFWTASLVPVSPPEGATQEQLDQAAREAAQISSQLLAGLS